MHKFFLPLLIVFLHFSCTLPHELELGTDVQSYSILLTLLSRLTFEDTHPTSRIPGLSMMTFQYEYAFLMS